MIARLFVFPIKGRNWCFTRAIPPSSSSAAADSASPTTPLTIKGLWKQISSNGKPVHENTELVIDFVSDKMNRAWLELEKAPQGTFKNKLHGLGLRLLSRVKPSETLLKSISKDVTQVEISYPTSLNPRLVRRRLRHIALRGTVIHRKYFYGSAALLPFTTALTVLPLPNVPFFWVLFRTYSHWQALKGSERLLLLVSDHSKIGNSASLLKDKREIVYDDYDDSPSLPWVLKPCEELGRLIRDVDKQNGLSKDTIHDICQAYHLDTNQVLKYRNTM